MLNVQLTTNNSCSTISDAALLPSTGSAIQPELGFGAPYPKQNLYQGPRKEAKLTSNGHSHTITVILTWEFLYVEVMWLSQR